MDPGTPAPLVGAVVERYLARDLARPAPEDSAALPSAESDALVAKLEALSPVAALAIIDACERLAIVTHDTNETSRPPSGGSGS